jgi:hypothetical protein
MPSDKIPTSYGKFNPEACGKILDQRCKKLTNLIIPYNFEKNNAYPVFTVRRGKPTHSVLVQHVRPESNGSIAKQKYISL